MSCLLLPYQPNQAFLSWQVGNQTDLTQRQCDTGLQHQWCDPSKLHYIDKTTYFVITSLTDKEDANCKNQKILN